MTRIIVSILKILQSVLVVPNFRFDTAENDLFEVEFLTILAIFDELVMKKGSTNIGRFHAVLDGGDLDRAGDHSRGRLGQLLKQA